VWGSGCIPIVGVNGMPRGQQIVAGDRERLLIFCVWINLGVELDRITHCHRLLVHLSARWFVFVDIADNSCYWQCWVSYSTHKK